jgi:hypothetical protein
MDAFSARHDFARLDRRTQFIVVRTAPESAPVLAHEVSAMLLEQVRNGRTGLLWFTQPDRRYTRRLPFWREAIHVFEPHALWSLVPHPGHADLRFFSVATDVALDLPALQALFGPGAQCRPLWRRFDARSLTWAEYLGEVQYGRGRCFISSLRFEGGLGCQPEGFDVNPWGAWLMASLLRPGGA